MMGAELQYTLPLFSSKKMRVVKNKTLKVQLWLAVVMVIFGCGLIVAGFCVAPTGEIHPTVLTAFGEILTFAGAVIGVDYSYKKVVVRRRKQEDEDDE